MQADEEQKAGGEGKGSSGAESHTIVMEGAQQALAARLAQRRVDTASAIKAGVGNYAGILQKIDPDVVQAQLDAQSEDVRRVVVQHIEAQSKQEALLRPVLPVQFYGGATKTRFWLYAYYEQPTTDAGTTPKGPPADDGNSSDEGSSSGMKV